MRYPQSRHGSNNLLLVKHWDSTVTEFFWRSCEAVALGQLSSARVKLL